MAKRTGEGMDLLYKAAEDVVRAAFANDDSLLTPGRSIWTLAHCTELEQRFVGNPDLGSDRFEVKLGRQLAGASDDVVQLAVEALYVYLWIVHPSEMGADTKLALLNGILGHMNTPVTVPERLQDALSRGIVRTGTGYHAARNAQFELVVRATAAWKALPGGRRHELLQDPWAFKTFVTSFPIAKSQPMQRVLLYLVFPDTFEPIVSKGDKERIVKTFRQHVLTPSDDIDRELQQVRSALESTYGVGFNFWDPTIKTIWKPKTSPWDTFLFWIEKVQANDEREYKLTVAEHMREARQAVLSNSETWQLAVKKGFGSPNNLVSHFIYLPFLEQCAQQPDTARAALQALWSAEDPFQATAFTEWDFAPGKVSRPGRAAILSVLLMGVDHAAYPPFRKSVLGAAYRLTGYAEPPKEPAAAYAHALGFFDELLKRGRERNLKLEDRLDAQSAVWCVVARGLPPGASAADRKALDAYVKGGESVADDDDDDDKTGGLPPDLRRTKDVTSVNALAGELLVDASFIEEVRELLEAKGQVIFYGPPGTGKTFVAKRLAEFFAGTTDASRLVQFHPSYSYEDFVEGYRPEKGGGFSLNDGPLKRAAKAARTGTRQVLVIDEINRGNAPKVLGELYFLLEYREEQIELQYSRERFELPKNLWFIGTMNTADRSIALLDAALRRRFFFVPFFPDEGPLAGLLGRWLKKHNPDLYWLEAVVALANARLQDRHASIGPSHFMKPGLDDAWVRRIWKYSVLPYVEERLIGQSERLKEFDLDALRAAASSVPL